MKKGIFLFLVLFTTAFAAAQDTYLKWAKQFAGTSSIKYSRGWDIATDDQGNVYSVGVFTGTVDFDPGPGVFNLTPVSTDVYISKLDAEGNFLWAKQITGSFGTLSRSFSLDSDNNIYITGTFQASVDFDPGPGSFYLTANGVPDVFVLKLTENGEFVWAKHFGNPAGAVFSNAIATDGFGNIYLAGSYSGTIDFDPGSGVFILAASPGLFSDAFICKLDASGNFTWAASIGAGGSDMALGISIGNTGELLITGIFSGTVDFDPGTAVFNAASNGLEDLFILRLNTGGDFTWVKTVGGTGPDGSYKAIADNAGNICITGYFRSTVDFDPGPAVFDLNAGSGSAIFVLKLDAAGNFTWAKAMGGLNLNTWGMAIATDKLNNIYTTGFFVGPVDFDPDAGNFTLNSAGIDVFICKLDAAGNFVWARSLGGANVDQGLAIKIDKAMNLYTTGFFSNTSDFDLESGTYQLTAIAISDAFVLKLAQCAVAFYTHVNASICSGQSYYAGGAHQTITGIYRDTLQTFVGCDSVIITNLTVHPVPIPDLGEDRKICTNEAVVITPGVFSDYQWQDHSNLSNLTINSPGKYWVTVTNAHHCSATDTLNILGLDTIPQNFLPPDQDLCYGNILQIAAPGYFTYQWSTGAANNFINVNNFGTYSLTVKDFNGCTGTDTITIGRKNCLYMGIPNAFTPDGNTINDVFKPVINQVITSFSFLIFNRYGQTIFGTTDYNKGWDGSFMGKPQPAGSYIYRIKYSNIFGVETVENGTFLLLR